MNNQGIIVTFAVIFMQAAVKSGKKQQQKTQSNMTILFVIAMKEEFNHLLSKFKDIPESRLGEYTFYKTESNGKTINLEINNF